MSGEGHSLFCVFYRFVVALKGIYQFDTPVSGYRWAINPVHTLVASARRWSFFARSSQQGMIVPHGEMVILHLGAG